MSFPAEIQKLQTSALIHLYSVDLSEIAPELPEGQQVLRFCPMVNELGEAVVWQGLAYTPYPCEADGFGVTSQGAPPRPLFRALNMNGILTDLCRAHQDFIQAKVTRHRTFARFLDAVNFVAGNSEADPDSYYPPDVFRVERKTDENDIYVEWELRWPFDLQGVVIPARAIIQNVCAWRYKSPECSWVPVEGGYYDSNDQPCSVENDTCSHKITGCKKRFGAKTTLPYGGWPGAGMIRR